MCSICRIDPALIEKRIDSDNTRFSVFAIRSRNKEGIIFNKIIYDIIKANTSNYWCNTEDITISSVCLNRTIINSSIQWNEFDYYDNNLITIGNNMLLKYFKLRAFV